MGQNTKRVPLTVRGAELLRKELNYLKNTERVEVIAAIAEARAHGDLSENAEYHAAKERQGFIEHRIAKIESQLSLADIIDCAALHHDGHIVFGVTVMLKDLDTCETISYQIVGEDEANIKQGLLSVSSPLARALIGKECGDVAEVHAPNGIREYEIVNIT